MKYAIVLLVVLGSFYLSPLNAADLICKFQFQTDAKTGERFAYTCNNDEELPIEDQTVTNVIGDHLYKDHQNKKRFTNDDVEIVDIKSEFISQIPKELKHFFPQMTKLSVTPKLYGFSQSDYVDLFQSLKTLQISVDHLPDNVFDDLVNLQELSLMDSALTSLPPMVFDKLHHLEIIRVHGSKSEKMDELPATLFKNNKNLIDISFHQNGLTCIRDGLFDGLNKLETVSFDNDCIKADLSKTVTLSEIKDKIHKQCQKCGDVIPEVVVVPVCPKVPGPNDPPGCPKLPEKPAPQIIIPMPGAVCPKVPGPNDPPGCPKLPEKPAPQIIIPMPGAVWPVAPAPVCPKVPGPNDPPGCRPSTLPLPPSVQMVAPMPGAIWEVAPVKEPVVICPKILGPKDPPSCYLSQCPYELKKLQEEYNKLKAQKDCKGGSDHSSKNKIELIFKHKQNKK